MLMFTHEHGSHTHTRPDAHRCHKHAGIGLLGDVETGSNLTSTSTPERMTDGNGTAVEVDLFEGNVEMLDRKDGLAGKSLIDLVEINVVLVQTH